MKELNKRECLELLEGVLESFSDIIGIYRPDMTIVMYNKAGYDFFKKNFKKSVKVENDRECYDTFEDTKICQEYKLQQCLKGKKEIKFKCFIEKTNKYMLCSYKPILDDNGEVIFIIENLRDITEKKLLQMSLKENKEIHKNIVALPLDGIVISQNNKIVFANSRVSEILGVGLDKIMNMNFIDLMPRCKSTTVKSDVNIILKEQMSKMTFEHKFINAKGEEIYVEVVASCITYKGQPAILSIVRDITKLKEDLNRAAKIQMEALPKKFILTEKVQIEYIYKPAKIVSGDFFQLNKKNDNLIIGILFDVSGNSISAALSVSAVTVLFNEAVDKLEEPSEIIKYLNKKATDHLRETYVAACCFSLDFEDQKMKIVSAGINEFTYISQGYNIENIILRGAFLGMFEDSTFEEREIKLSKEDRILLYSDGLEQLFKEPGIENKLINTPKIKELDDYINIFLNNLEGNRDDCTLINIKIK